MRGAAVSEPGVDWVSVAAGILAGVIPAAVAWGAASARLRALEESKPQEMSSKIVRLETRVEAFERQMSDVRLSIEACEKRLSARLDKLEDVAEETRDDVRRLMAGLENSGRWRVPTTGGE